MFYISMNQIKLSLVNKDSYKTIKVILFEVVQYNSYFLAKLVKSIYSTNLLVMSHIFAMREKKILFFGLFFAF